MNKKDIIKRGTKLAILYGMETIIGSGIRGAVPNNIGPIKNFCVSTTGLLIGFMAMEKVGSWTDLKIDQLEKFIKESEATSNA